MAGVPGMHSGGSNRKTQYDHRLAGAFRHDRHSHLPVGGPPRVSEPASQSVPRPPAGLSALARKMWREIHAQFEVSSAPTRELLVSALRSLDMAEAARTVLEQEGLTYLDGGKPKAHPAAAIHRDARAQFVMTMRVLGFPEDR